MYFKKIAEPTLAAAGWLSEEPVPFLSLPYPGCAVPLSYLVLTAILIFSDPLAGQLNSFSQEKHSPL